MKDNEAAKTHWRKIFISDIHLGSRLSNAKALNEFLKRNTCDQLYLVGDIIDVWHMKNGINFPNEHMIAIRKIIKRSTSGTEVYYIPGNHDEILRDLIPATVGSIKLIDEMVITTESGKTYLVIHGDIYDQCCKHAKWLVRLGDFGYTTLIRANGVLNMARRQFGLGYWSLSAFAKSKVKRAVNFIGQYEEIVAKSVKDRGVDGVICGHIHHAEMRYIDGIHYVNTGDFCESLTAVVEDDSGDLRVLLYEDWCNK